MIRALKNESLKPESGRDILRHMIRMNLHEIDRASAANQTFVGRFALLHAFRAVDVAAIAHEIGRGLFRGEGLSDSDQI